MQSVGPQSPSTPSPSLLAPALVELYAIHMVGYSGMVKRQLLELDPLVRRVTELHAHCAPDVLPEILIVFRELSAELDRGLGREGRHLRLLSGEVELRNEHETWGALLTRLRELSQRGRFLGDEVVGWRELRGRLQTLESSVRELVSLEREFLDPQLRGEVHIRGGMPALERALAPGSWRVTGTA